MRLQSKVAIISGGASGIGRETCQLFAREGAKIAVIDINEQHGLQTVELIQQEGGEAIFIRTDVSKEDDVIRMVDQVIEHYQRIDVLFNNATWYTIAAATDMPLADWQKTLDINLTGPFLCCKYVLPEMMKHGGSIINTSSVGGTSAFYKHPAYNAAKAGVNLLTKNLALDYGKHQVRVNCISPGIIETPLTQRDLQDPEKFNNLTERCFTGRIGKPSDIAYAALYLASDESTFVTGSNMMVDNGWTAR
ncbi:SDR family NAD(P)-dependent oxidoreductase [Paenibacillus mendelii]|uniref:SDR family NAD(P)-dependent oxidoreductase n=1 Tax=Paenibacillus mendelii TaxID=206163 RepID=A0ABV6JGA1_9BACL|nr:SDR family oxidoreductase [Paenibacillus mendelii]MCQ6557442.1 SDR family oxidoreductase [Paenibacillus mendelii]